MTPSAQNRAAELATALSMGFVTDPRQLTGLTLEVSDRGLALRDYAQPRSRSFEINPLQERVRADRRDLLARALGKRARVIIDATAGFGADSFDFVHRGKQVVAIEREPLVALLLQDAAQKLASAGHRGALRVVVGDAYQLIPTLPSADVIFLDPMFPDTEKKTAQPRKAQQLLRRLAGVDVDSTRLLTLARRHVGQRVVVKRPRHAAPLAVTPHHCLMGRAIRYDIYLPEGS